MGFPRHSKRRVREIGVFGWRKYQQDILEVRDSSYLVYFPFWAIKMAFGGVAVGCSTPRRTELRLGE